MQSAKQEIEEEEVAPILRARRKVLRRRRDDRRVDALTSERVEIVVEL